MENERLDYDVQKRLNYSPVVDNSKNPNVDGNPGAATILAAAGGVAGGFATSGIALTAAEGSGLAAYSAGLASILTKVGCGSVSALTSFSLLAAGPIIGGILGIAVYKAIKNSNF
ncbi:MAG: hypothetical protein HQK91_03865 [Nitrospirae bacterium]|nr:hypothetical protein [Nitrospirota bacterium]MBF0540573.1 hypothetical protein [Nitrospirota bacterium]